jgi:hypothetical protein
MAGVIAPGSRADAGAFLARVLRLDKAAVVRLRPAPAAPGTPTGAERGGVVGTVAIWARLPFGVLATRGLRAAVTADVTVRADALLAAVEADGPALPPAVDAAWRWALPPGPGTTVETLPAAEVRRVADAAAEAVRAALSGGMESGRAVGTRRIRDAMLDHVPIVVSAGPQRIQVPQRLVQGLLRMGFLGAEPVAVRSVAGWVALAAEHGACWHRTAGGNLAVRIAPYRPNG